MQGIACKRVVLSIRRILRQVDGFIEWSFTEVPLIEGLAVCVPRDPSLQKNVTTAITANTQETTRPSVAKKPADDAGSDDVSSFVSVVVGGASVDETAWGDFTASGHAASISVGRSLSGLQPIM